MVDIDRGSLGKVVGRFVIIKPGVQGEDCSDQSNIEEEFIHIYQKHERTERKSKANNYQEWETMRRKLWCEYGPRFQAWSDRHKLGYQFIWDTRD